MKFINQFLIQSFQHLTDKTIFIEKMINEEYLNKIFPRQDAFTMSSPFQNKISQQEISNVYIYYFRNASIQDLIKNIY
ncbi:unnamed protein product [Paramecium pentaurelia]|uniref:Uncharacterized protein n=1 Tax=Paramecium pentaurelia TaxID=43138 RepID=A0A8S1UGQ0_9CILI|nr:unnamed protein product [Paramecium pentaurelia]